MSSSVVHLPSPPLPEGWEFDRTAYVTAGVMRWRRGLLRVEAAPWAGGFIAIDAGDMVYGDAVAAIAAVERAYCGCYVARGSSSSRSSSSEV